MSEEERTLVDTSGDYCYAVRGGEPVAEPEWRSCRLVLTSERLVLANSNGKQAVSHAEIDVLEEDAVDADGIDAAGATPLRVGEHVVLVDAPDVDSLQQEYARARVDGEVILANPRAVVGGVVQDDAEWGKARFSFGGRTIELQFPDGGGVTIDVGDVGTVDSDTGTVMDEDRTVVKVGHTDDEGGTVETHLSGMDHHTDALESLFVTIVEERVGDHELSETERQVLMALYSGVSPFEMADFVGLGVDEVEETYQTLLEVGAVDEVRTRTEVTLNAEGRNMASEAMNEE